MSEEIKPPPFVWLEPKVREAAEAMPELVHIVTIDDETGERHEMWIPRDKVRMSTGVICTFEE